MEELIFFAVLIFFSIIESIARSRKQRQGGGPLPELPEEPEAEPRQARTRPAPQRPRPSLPPSYDDDESFDARLPTEEGRSLEAETSYDQVAASEAERRRREASSESMIPADIWEEIAGLAREAEVELPKPQPRPPKPQPRRVPQPGRLPRPAPRPQPRARPAPSPARAPGAPARRQDVEGTSAHPVHLSHAGYGTDPSERAASALQPTPPAVHQDAAAVRRQLRSQGANALRRALILQEILGPPAASKPDRFQD